MSPDSLDFSGHDWDEPAPPRSLREVLRLFDVTGADGERARKHYRALRVQVKTMHHAVRAGEVSYRDRHLVAEYPTMFGARQPGRGWVLVHQPGGWMWWRKLGGPSGLVPV